MGLGLKVITRCLKIVLQLACMLSILGAKRVDLLITRTSNFLTVQAEEKFRVNVFIRFSIILLKSVDDIIIKHIIV